MKANESKTNNENKGRNVAWVGTIAVIVACIIVILGIVLHLKNIPFGPYDPGDIVMMLLMLFFVALVIERVVEVVIIVTRDAGEKMRQDNVNRLEGQPKKKGDDEAKLLKAKADLKSYKATTKIFSISLLFVLGVIISAAGLRVLLPLVDMTVFRDLPVTQKTIFNAIDVIITGALLGGGSKGIHEIIEGVLNSVEWYREFVKHKRKKLDS